MPELDSEALDFRAASESFAPLRKLKRALRSPTASPAPSLRMPRDYRPRHSNADFRLRFWWIAVAVGLVSPGPEEVRGVFNSENAVRRCASESGVMTRELVEKIGACVDNLRPATQ